MQQLELLSFLLFERPVPSVLEENTMQPQEFGTFKQFNTEKC